jgi:outer membrane protein assembly factor BamA
VRGCDVSSFSASDCTTAIDGGSSCPEFDRLIGSRIVVASAELRVPLFGSRELGLLNLPFLPTEVSPFLDAGVAWERGSNPVLRFDRESVDRVPVVGTGVTARVNIFGYAVGEVYWANPFQRSGGGGRFGFQLAPGW